MAQPLPIVPSLQGRVHADEWAARVELAACYRVFAMLGWTEMIYNHITLRLPDSVTGGEKHFLINPFGLHYSEVTASNLVKINMQGEVLDGSPHKVNPAGFVVHATLHSGIEGAHCVMHTHTTAGVAVACLKDGLLQSNFYSAQLHDMVAYHDFEGITVHAEEAPRLLASMGIKPLLILRNHGALVVGRTIGEAFNWMHRLELSCRAQVQAMACNTPLQAVPESVLQATYLNYQPQTRRPYGVMEWPGLLRMLTRLDPSFRD